MRIEAPRRRSVNLALLPMINVVFLLLIFFLLAGRMQPAPPMDVTPPEVVAAAEAEGEFTLYIDMDGQMVFQDLVTRNPDLVMMRLDRMIRGYCAGRDCAARPPQLLLFADRRLPAAVISGLLPDLAVAGLSRVDLVTQAIGGHE